MASSPEAASTNTLVSSGSGGNLSPRFEPTSPVKEPPPQFFGPEHDSFELGEKLGKGSQAEVYKCRRLTTGMLYAVKKVDVASLEYRNKASKVRTNLRREVHIMRELTHPRIVNLLEAYWQQNVCLIVMDLATGGSLHSKLVPGVGLPGGERPSQHIACQLLEGMGYMHAHNVIHRDLKPENVLLMAPTSGMDIEGVFYDVKIADFGLSRCLHAVGGQRKDMTRCGTPQFAAPEVVRGDYDEKADYWSFGCLIYTMLCGEYPFPDDVPDHLLHPEKYKRGSAQVYQCDAWKASAVDAKSIVNGLLRCDSNARLGLKGCLQHPWLADEAAHLSPVHRARRCERVTTLSPAELMPELQEFHAGKHGGLMAFLGCLLPCWPTLPDPAGMDSTSFSSRRSDRVKRRATSLDSRRDGSTFNGVVSQINGWTGSAVDVVELRMRNGQREILGGSKGGDRNQRYLLQDDEVVVAVKQELHEYGQHLGNALIFLTSRCQVITLQGTVARRKQHFIAPAGYQISGLQFDQSHLTGIHIETVGPKKNGSVECITGWVGFAVDRIQFAMRRGEVFDYGAAGGDVSKEEFLRPREYIVIVEQSLRDGYLGDAIVFYTSMGKVLQFRGMECNRSVRYMAMEGQQICGVEFKGHPLQYVSTCPLDGNLSQVETHEVTIM